jgi:hypothetical protein
MDLDGIFSPLSQEYCIYFYYLQVIGFIFLVLLMLSCLFLLISGDTKKGKNKTSMFAMLVMIATYGIFYFQNRLLYSICVKSL